MESPKACSRHKELLVVYRCVDCSVDCCLRCAHPHTDKGHSIGTTTPLPSPTSLAYAARSPMSTITMNVKTVGGVTSDQKPIAPPETHTNVKFNEGAEVELDLGSAVCPCGKRFHEDRGSAICCVCGTLTCSDECHTKFVQKVGRCRYHLNFTETSQSKHQGCRCIKRRDIVKTKFGESLIQCGSRYIEAEVTKQKDVLVLRRGYCQFGQPHVTTLKHLKISKSVQDTNNERRVCTCPCEECCLRFSHPEHACERRASVLRERQATLLRNIQDVMLRVQKLANEADRPKIRPTASVARQQCADAKEVIEMERGPKENESNDRIPQQNIPFDVDVDATAQSPSESMVGSNESGISERAPAPLILKEIDLEPNAFGVRCTALANSGETLLVPKKPLEEERKSRVSSRWCTVL